MGLEAKAMGGSSNLYETLNKGFHMNFDPKSENA
jgi:hypothetical protein